MLQAVVRGLYYAAQAQFEISSGRVECAPSTREDVLGSMFHWLGLECTATSDLSKPKYDIPSAVAVRDRHAIAAIEHVRSHALAVSASRRYPGRTEIDR